MSVGGEPHPHSFFRDGAETRNVEAISTDGLGIEIRSSIAGLLVLKSTGSAFHGFYVNEYTLLKPTNDRILSTEVDAGWKWKTFESLRDVKEVIPQFDEAYEAVRTITLETFATESSPSVQNTMYKMCEQILSKVQLVRAVDYSLPNKHYFEIGMYLSPLLKNLFTDVVTDLSWHKGLKNTGEDAEVYAPQSDPNGLIQCTVSR